MDMTHQVQRICETFRRQTLRISDEVDRASFTGLGIQEETITDLLLNNIQFEHKENFFTRKFTHKEEGSYSGADWLWCIGEPGAWITFAVQAKIANIETGRVNYLHYREGEQYSLLINFAKQFGFIPKYSIYTQIDSELDLFSRKYPELSSISSEQWSFTAVSPKYIKRLTTPSERHISTVLQFAVPWTYVFCSNSNSNESIADTIARKFENIYWPFENEFRHKYKQKPRYSYERMNWENPQPTKLVSDSMPLLVLYLMTKRKYPHKVPIANVSVYSKTPVLESLNIELEKIEGSRQWKNFPEVFERKIEKIENGERLYMLPDGNW